MSCQSLSAVTPSPSPSVTFPASSKTAPPAWPTSATQNHQAIGTSWPQRSPRGFVSALPAIAAELCPTSRGRLQWALSAEEVAVAVHERRRTIERYAVKRLLVAAAKGAFLANRVDEVDVLHSRIIVERLERMGAREIRERSRRRHTTSSGGAASRDRRPKLGEGFSAVALIDRFDDDLVLRGVEAIDHIEERGARFSAERVPETELRAAARVFASCGDRPPARRFRRRPRATRAARSREPRASFVGREIVQARALERDVDLGARCARVESRRARAERQVAGAFQEQIRLRAERLGQSRPFSFAARRRPLWRPSRLRAVRRR